MPEKKPIPVRLDDEMIARLDAAAERMGTNRAALIRFLTERFLNYFEEHGGVIALPLDWREILHLQDGRTFGQKQQSPPIRKTTVKYKRARARDIRTVSLSVFGGIPAGWPQDFDSSRYSVRYVKVPRGRFPDGAFGLDVRGDSMNAARPEPILDGDVVILLRPEDREPKSGDIVAALIDGETCLKRLVNGDSPAYLTSESTNPAYGKLRPLRELVIQGVVIGKL